MDQVDRDRLAALRQQNIGRLFQRAARAYSELALQKLRERGYDGLTLFHTALISNLDLQGTGITTLADRAGVTKQAMGQLVAELEERGFVKRLPNPDDKRAALIQFTEAGWQFLQDAYHVKNEIEAEYTGVLGEAGMEQLRSLLEVLLDAPSGK
jgi:DNA-binding MarR family transcriptional regulator